MKRIFLFLATNLAVVVLLGLVANLLGVNRYLVGTGLNLPSLLVFAAIFGMGGSLISPGSKAKAASSNSLTMTSRPNQPSVPP